jgi:acyl-coenzyme A thioesterase PaaI-like protein
MSRQLSGDPRTARLPRMSDPSLQERYAPHNACFGCGPSNDRGLRIRSFYRDGVYTAEWHPEPYHEAFPDVVSGGILGTLLDCHMNWSAAHHLMLKTQRDSPPCTVTAEYSVRLLRPTPSKATLSLEARIIESSEDRATVECTLSAEGKPRATGRGIFVAVQPGHPAYHRW